MKTLRIIPFLFIIFLLIFFSGCQKEPAIDIEFTDWPSEENVSLEVDYDNTHAWVFSESQDVACWSGSGATIDVEHGFLTVRPTTHDPIITISFSPEQYINASDYKYIAYRYRAQTKLSQGVFFVGSTTNPNFSDNGLLFFDVDKSGNWTNYVTDISQCPYWTDTIIKFRIDPINSMNLDEGSCIWIDRVGFFKTEKEAQQFLDSNSESNYTGADVIYGDMMSVYLPSRIKAFEQKQADFMIKDMSQAKTADAVMKNGIVIPISYVNPAGYAFYVASEKGDYSLTTLNYSNASPLSFVQKRGILNGKKKNSKLSKEDITDIINALTMGSDKTTEYVKEVTDGTVRDLCSAFYAFVKDEEFDLYKSIFRQNPIIDGENLEAVKFAWQTGIIDYQELSNIDSVLTAQKAAEMTEKLIKSILGLPVLSSSEPKSKLMIGGWYSASDLQAEDLKKLDESGINLVVLVNTLPRSFLLRSLKMAEEYGIRIMIRNYGPESFNKNSPVSPAPMNAMYYDFDSYLGNMIYDEPGSDSYQMISELTKFYQTELPGKIPFFNLLPMYANAAQLKYGAGASKIDYYDPDPDLYRKYVEAYAKQVGTDYICVDIYPNRSNARGKTTYDGYLKNMDIFSSVCREYDRDFWLYVQTVGLDGVRKPDYEDMRWQMYIGLSFGVKTFIHFTYNTYIDQGWTESMVDTFGEPTSVYTAAQEANLEIKELSDAYLSYKNIGTYTVNVKAGMTYAKLAEQFEGIKGLNIESKLPLLIGCFKPNSGNGFAFTLVNMTDLSKDESDYVSFTVDSRYKNVMVWQNGISTVLEPIDNEYYIELDIAEGVFVTVK